MCGVDFLSLATQLDERTSGVNAREFQHSFVMLVDCAMMDMLSDVAPCYQSRMKESQVDSEKQMFNRLVDAMAKHAARATSGTPLRDCGTFGGELRWAQTLDSLVDLDPRGTELHDVARGPRLKLLDIEAMRHLLPLINALEKSAKMGVITQERDKELIMGLRAKHRAYLLGPKPRRYSERSPSTAPSRRLAVEAQIEQTVWQQQRWGPLYGVRRWFAELGKDRQVIPILRPDLQVATIEEAVADGATASPDIPPGSHARSPPGSLHRFSSPSMELLPLPSAGEVSTNEMEAGMHLPLGREARSEDAE